ncbi:MAG: 2-phosphosulfolactate phosphatase [Pseudopedobacter saltans]|uniref:Probable 2-phosphosulfolactate phosphatase n=1 Tax=Pseudopedobacter saltans TaxID=151895 RepID=A0A2W5HDE7_9SPHI|nr:MAG: 2-phosphosulfolactate phosphatase [Pseudopedobacter saltans]
MQRPTLHTVLSPRLLDLYELTDSVVVIIDVFRATSTIATALYNGAIQVIPVPDVETCIKIGKETPNSVTAGEREGKVIPGLQYGNSPAEYSKEFIEGKTLVLTTTNGTKLLNMALLAGASDIITGSFPNLSAVCNYLLSSNKNVILGCSGWKDKVNLEDTLFAGAIASRIGNKYDILCDSTLMAQKVYEDNAHDLISIAKKATHWHRLSNYGLSYDLEYCISADVANVLCQYKEGKLIIP